MKQLLVLLFLVSSMACFGQNKDALKDISSVTFYGIDFTRAKVYGAKAVSYTHLTLPTKA